MGNGKEILNMKETNIERLMLEMTKDNKIDLSTAMTIVACVLHSVKSADFMDKYGAHFAQVAKTLCEPCDC